MDTAEMISEKRLKQGFVLATLISTVAGTFVTSINLYDRLVEQRKQKKLDRGQNKRIKELEQRLNEAEEEKKRIREERERGRGGDNENTGDGDFRNSLQRSGSMVQNEYDRYFANLGPRFAQGDLVAQNQIQSQIILLQGNVIKLLEEALLTGTIPDINRLYNTAEFARDGSIQALRDQYSRLLESAPPQRRPRGLIRKTSSTPSLRDDSVDSVWSHRGPARNALAYGSSAPLFCRAAEEVQRTGRPLEACIAVGRSGARCAACGAGPGSGDREDGCRSWRIEKEIAVRSNGWARDDRRSSRSSDDGSETIVVRTYLLTPRFIFKCHREETGYACCLCSRHRDRDTLCRSEEALVSHITSKHSVTEYEGDRDIKELNRTLPYR